MTSDDFTAGELECLIRIAWCHVRGGHDYRERPFGGMGEGVHTALDKAARLLAKEDGNGPSAKARYQATRRQEIDRRKERLAAEPESRRRALRQIARWRREGNPIMQTIKIEGLPWTDKFQEFMASLPWKIDVLWQGKSGVHRLDDDRRVTIELAIVGSVDHYPGCRVKLFSKTNGEIVAKYFSFNEYLDIADLTPESAAHPNVKHVQHFYVWTGGTWYIAVPSDPSPFTQAIETWIDEWR